MTFDVLEWERRGLNAWPALHTAKFGRWVFRTSGGYTNRANSANATRLSSEARGRDSRTPDFREVMAAAEDFYAASGQPTIFRLTPLAGAEADPTLEAAGYDFADPCTVMIASLEAGKLSAQARIDLDAGSEWLDGAASAQNIARENRPVHDRILRSIPSPKAFATLYFEKAAVAFGVAVFETGAVGLFDIIVQPAFRGRGLGRDLARALMVWGRTQGAEAAYLQVADSNRMAIGLYESLGFHAAYGYHYRRRPT